METVFKQSGDFGILALSCDLTIEFAAELKPALAKALNSGLPVVLDIADVTRADVSCLQLICAAHRATILAGTSLTLSNAGEGFNHSLIDTGFIRHVGCSPETEDTCLWLEYKKQNRND
jgi:anti-anti-sigma regulatory factor